MRIVIIACLLLAAWPYACLAYLSELKKIVRELKLIKLEIRDLKEETKCEDTSAESIG